MKKMWKRALAALILDEACREGILCHNHPKGTAAFSDADLDATRSVRAGLGVLGVVLSDHLLVAGREVISMKKLGLMKFTETP